MARQVTTQKRWWHGTTKDCWEQIKEEGVLWGVDEPRQTFLARNLDELIRMINLPLIGDLRKCQVVLSVKYVPNGKDDDYDPRWWEMIVKAPISIENVKLAKYL